MYRPTLTDNVETCLGVMANRTNKEPYIEDAVTTLLKEYVYLDVKSYLGITFEEYLDITPVIRDTYIKFLEPMAEEKRLKLEELNGMKNDMKEVADNNGL